VHTTDYLESVQFSPSLQVIIFKAEVLFLWTKLSTIPR